MAKFVTGSLAIKLIVCFVLVAVIPVGIVGYLSYRSARDSLVNSFSDKLQMVGEDRKKGIRDFFRDAMMDSTFLSKDIRMREVFRLMASAKEGVYEAAPQEQKGDTELARRIESIMGSTFVAWEDLYGKRNGYRDVIVLDQDGQIAYTLKKESELGENVKRGALKGSGLARVWERVIQTGKPGLVDFSYYQPSSAPAAFAGIPYFNQNNKLQGVIAVRIGVEGINEVFSQAQGLGKTAESYALGSDLVMRSNSRFEKTSTILTKKVDTEGGRAALDGKTGIKIYKDYRSEPVLGFFTPVGLSQIAELGADFDWVMLAEIDEAEVMEPVRSLGTRIACMALIVALIVAAVALVISRTITRPVIALSTQVARASTGDLTVEISGTDRGDELGVLAQSVHLMVSNLRSQVGMVLEAAIVVSSAAAEISATAAQVVTSTTQTTAAVAESATTAAQVRQAALMAGEKAKEVAQSAQKAVHISADGAKATEDTVSKINLIRDQMESIGETVVRLSEHSQAIEAIIATVQDIADQSNLLAVNASIEAARAGDQGKGFAVVAQEIKILADQSRQSTQQVRTILEETRKWVSAVVMATEQGAKAVEAGVVQAEVAGAAIQSLSGGVQGWAQTATLVDSSSQQQAAGADQVSGAMGSIDQAMQQVLSGVSQLEGAAKRLEDLAKSVSQLLSGYKV